MKSDNVQHKPRQNSHEKRNYLPTWAQMSVKLASFKVIFLFIMITEACQGAQQVNLIDKKNVDKKNLIKNVDKKNLIKNVDKKNLIKKRLVKIRDAAIAYLETKKPLNWDVHLIELRRGAIMHVEGNDRIGRWVFENDTLILLREADVAPEVRSYGMVFKQKKDMSFTVVHDFWEKESFEFPE